MWPRSSPLLTGASKVSYEGEKRLFRRERELLESLRRMQREEARALEHQREQLEKQRAANAREAAAERGQIESLRKAQLEEAKDLSRLKEELQKEKAELQEKWEELQQEREKLLLFSRGQQASWFCYSMATGLLCCCYYRFQVSFKCFGTNSKVWWCKNVKSSFNKIYICQKSMSSRFCFCYSCVALLCGFLNVLISERYGPLSGNLIQNYPSPAGILS